MPAVTERVTSDRVPTEAPMKTAGFDVCVFGAGPAGIATAIRLAGTGVRVAILDRPAGDPPWVGETFSGAIRTPLAELGLWEGFRDAGHVRGYEIRSVWGGPEMQAQNA